MVGSTQFGNQRCFFLHKMLMRLGMQNIHSVVVFTEALFSAPKTPKKQNTWQFYLANDVPQSFGRAFL